MSTSSGPEGSSDDSLYPIAVLIDELRNEDVQVWYLMIIPELAEILWLNMTSCSLAAHFLPIPTSCSFAAHVNWAYVILFGVFVMSFDYSRIIWHVIRTDVDNRNIRWNFVAHLDFLLICYSFATYLKLPTHLLLICYSHAASQL